MVRKNLVEVFALKIRVKFEKTGVVRFIGHLDIMRYFQKAMRRCAMPIKYSEGFSPHQIMSFGAPLSLGMVDGILSLVPTAKVGHIGLYRDEVTHIPHEYYCKLPRPIDERIIVVTDPMLATGGSAIDAISQIKAHGGKKIKFMCIIAAPEGLKALEKAHPDIQIYIGHLDRQLNADAYICPGLGDAGDRIFGTK